MDCRAVAAHRTGTMCTSPRETTTTLTTGTMSHLVPTFGTSTEADGFAMLCGTAAAVVVVVDGGATTCLLLSAADCTRTASRGSNVTTLWALLERALTI